MPTSSNMPPHAHAHAQSSRHPHNQSYRHLQIPKEPNNNAKGKRPVYLHEHRRPPPRGDGVGGGGEAGLLQGFPTEGRQNQQQHRQQQGTPVHEQAQAQPGPGLQWPSWTSFRNQGGQSPHAGAGPNGTTLISQAASGINNSDARTGAAGRHAPPLPSSLQAQAHAQEQTQGNSTPHLDTYIASQLGGGAPKHHDDNTDDAMRNYHDGNNDDASMATDYTSGTTWTAGTTTTYGGGNSIKTSTHVPKPDKAGYNRKWTDVAYKKYVLGMQVYRAKGE